MNSFYVSMDCPDCGEDIYIGPAATFIERGGMPVLPYDFAAQESFSCECGKTWITGDFEAFDSEDL